MKTYTCENVKIPSWALPAIVNADPTGLSDDDEGQIDAYEQSLSKYCKDHKYTKGFAIVPDYNSSPEFCHYPEFGLPCNCWNCTIVFYL
jgi:hypothetical protein